MNFNIIKDLLVKLAKENGLAPTDLEERDPETGLCAWSIDWNDDLNESFHMDIMNLQAGLDLYEEALSKNDLLTAKAGLQDAKIASQDLANFFDAFREDLTKVMIDSRFNWPKFPEDYKVPEHYGYKSR